MWLAGNLQNKIIEKQVMLAMKIPFGSWKSIFKFPTIIKTSPVFNENATPTLWLFLPVASAAGN